MEIRHTDTPPTALPADAPAPGPWASMAAIAGYFALQLTAGALALLTLATGDVLVSGHVALAGLEAASASVLRQPALQALLAMFSLGVAASLTLWLVHRRWASLWSLAQPPGFGFVAPRRPLFFALAVVLGLSAPILGEWLTGWLAQGHTVTQDIQQLGGHTPLGLRLPLVLVVVCVGPLAEELLFRGVLLSALMRRWPVGWAVGGSSLLFALVHLPGLEYQWYALPNLILLAVLLAGLRLRSGSIWPAVLAHGVNNLLAVAAWFVAINPPG